MRIISGTYKGRRFNPTGLKNTRPTTDFAREGLFNILNNQLYFEDLKVLDLFSGSGAVAVEFISRGVQKLVSVERDVACVKYIHSLKEEFKIDNLEILKSDALRYLNKSVLKFDVIFADPPYDYKDYDNLLEVVHERKLLSLNGLFVLEHDKRMDFEEYKGFQSKRKFGNVYFSFFSNS